MPTSINRAQLQNLLAQGAQLVEVLPEAEYVEEHLPAAIHLPLKALTANAAASKLDRARPVIVYCWDSLCDMSPRAAQHLERFGFAPIYDYTTGKADWIAAGLPTDGESPPSPRVTAAMDPKVPTCHPTEQVAEVVERARALGWEMVVVVNHQNIILGRVRFSRIHPQSTEQVDDVMEPGPATVHADALLEETRRRMTDRQVDSLIVSTPDGELLGVIRR